MKNPFKKSSIVDTLVNVGIGGAANVAMNYAFSNIEALAGLSDTLKNAIKIGVGVVGGTMVGGSYAKYVRPALDGLATVGASEIISDFINSTTTQTTTGGVRFMGGGMGRISMGQKGFKKPAKGTGAVAFQGK